MAQNSSESIHFLTFAFIFLAPVMSKTTLAQWLKMKEKTHSVRKVQVLITHNTVRVAHTFSAYDKTIYMSCSYVSMWPSYVSD